MPFPVLLSILIRNRFQVEPATLLIPIDFSFPFRGGGALRYLVPKWLLFLINVGSGFHSFSFSFSMSSPLFSNAQDVIKFGQSTRDYVLLYEELAVHK